jgi:hypothetical protein
MRWGRLLVAAALLAAGAAAPALLDRDGTAAPALVPFEVPPDLRPDAETGTLVVRIGEEAAAALRADPGSASVLVLPGDSDGQRLITPEPLRLPGYGRRLAPGAYTVSLGRGTPASFPADCSIDVRIVADRVSEVAFLGFPPEAVAEGFPGTAAASPGACVRSLGP